jgi:hypothetical protein
VTRSDGPMSEIERESRFEFGKNWRNFLVLIDEERITAAMQSLKSMLNMDNLTEKVLWISGAEAVYLVSRRGD